MNQFLEKNDDLQFCNQFKIINVNQVFSDHSQLAV